MSTWLKKFQDTQGSPPDQTDKSQTSAELAQELESAGLSKNWRDYLLERVEILVDHEGYSGEEARDEVLAMVPYYQELN